MNLRNIIIQNIGKMIPDKIWIQLKYRQWFGKWADLKNPKTYNEKLNWIKLYDRNPEYTIMVDKYEAKKWISDKIGNEYVIPILGGPWNSFDEIDFSSLPDQFVLKTTHDCGGVVVCKDKKKMDMKKTEEFLEKHLKNNYYLTGREWPYKNIKPRIFAESYMTDGLTEKGKKGQLTDYKFFCFDGVPKVMFIATDRTDETVDTKFDFYDMKFNHLPIIQGHPNSKVLHDKPRSFEKMKEIAAQLSIGIPQIRVDFYEVDGRVYVGELTLFHYSGTVPFNPEKWDYIFGEWINLKRGKKCKN